MLSNKIVLDLVQASAKFIAAAIMCISVAHADVLADVKEYQFNIETTMVNFTGKPVEALTVGGGIPAPLIEAYVGDTLRVTFHNKMKVESSIHWHGVLLPNDQDGVPYMTTSPIRAGESLTFEYPVIHSGTYWYHSHTGLQEQRGVYGPIIFREKGEPEDDEIIVLSDWTDENPKQVLANLKKDDHYYALKKGSVQSWDKVIAHGMEGIKNRLSGAWSRMGPMDISDVGYDAFLANGQQTSEIEASSMQSIKLRIINAAASSYFNLEYAGGPMTIVAADGMPVEPIQVKRLKMAIAETYDVIITAPHHGAAEFRATSEDGTGYSSVFVGSGERSYAPDIPKPNPYVMDHSMHQMDKGHGEGTAHQDHRGHAMMEHHAASSEAEVIDHLTDYETLRSPIDTSLNTENPWRNILLTLTGTMERYIWGFDGKTLRESDKILIKKGENVRITLKNTTMMHHPVHLHGHFFRVVTGQDTHSPLKHTVNIPPMSEVVIEFAANEEKDWFFHCHNLYHMKSGMSRVISYGDNEKFDPAILSKISSDPWFKAGELFVSNTMTEADFELMNTRSTISVAGEYGFDEKDYEVTGTYTRYLSRFFALFGGARLERDGAGEPSETRAIVGANYVLPLLIDATLELDDRGHFELGLESDLQLTSRINFEWEWTHEFSEKTDEYKLALSYELSKRWVVSAVHDSEFGSGIGLRTIF